jgi:cytidine deaminase
MSFEHWIDAAGLARSHAYAPYSKFALGVGAALLGKSGKIFTGCNVENVSLGLTICAERNAVASAIAAGEKGFVAMAVVTDFHEPVFPCGACRQVLAEFHQDLQIITSTIKGRTESALLSELLSHSRQRILGPSQNV